MKKKIKKTFVFLMLPVVFSNSFPFLKLQLKKKEENPDTVQTQYLIGEQRNIFISAISSTASTVTGFFRDRLGR